MNVINYLTQLEENFNNYIIHRQPEDFTITIIADFDSGVDVKATATTASQAAKLAMNEYLMKNEFKGLTLKDIMDVHMGIDFRRDDLSNLEFTGTYEMKHKVTDTKD